MTTFTYFNSAYFGSYDIELNIILGNMREKVYYIKWIQNQYKTISNEINSAENSFTELGFKIVIIKDINSLRKENKAIQKLLDDFSTNIRKIIQEEITKLRG